MIIEESEQMKIIILYVSQIDFEKSFISWIIIHIHIAVLASNLIRFTSSPLQHHLIKRIMTLVNRAITILWQQERPNRQKKLSCIFRRPIMTTSNNYNILTKDREQMQRIILYVSKSDFDRTFISWVRPNSTYTCDKSYQIHDIATWKCDNVLSYIT